MYAELHALSNFSFLARRFAARGAGRTGQVAWAIARSPSPMNARSRAWCARTSPPSGTSCRSSSARSSTVPIELKLVALATDRASYGAMSRLISRARCAGAKGSYALERADLENALDGCLIVWLPRAGRAALPQHLEGRPLAARALRGAPVDRRRAADRRRSMRAAWSSSRRWVRRSNCRRSPPATCTCIGAAAARCRTC